jgi:hypothetical protein
MHVAHENCLSVVVQIIDEFDVLPNESENHTPVSVDRDRVEPPQLAGQRMLASTWRCEIARLRRGIQGCQLQPELGRMLRLDSDLGAAPEKRLEALVSEAPNHASS